MKTKLEELKKKYEELFELLDSFEHNFDRRKLDERRQWHLWGIELKEKYNLDVPVKEINSVDYNRIDDYRSIGMYGKKYNRTLSRSDNSKQPEGECLLSIRFSTGAYIFGNNYLKETFAKFWQELLTFNPKYKDTTNSCLYFSLDNAAPVFNSFWEIYRKYSELSKEEYKKIEKESLLKKLQELEEDEN